MKRFFLISNFLIFLSLAISIYFVSKTYLEFIKYKSLNKKSLAKITEWEITENKGVFTLSAKYDYFVEGKNFSGKIFFENKKFFNYQAAFEELNKLAKKKWEVWYSSKNFEISNIEKHFPIKNGIYSIISVIIFIYFIFLKKRIKVI
ncbi:MAG: hypothetical protein AMS24_02140 [Chlamydiae bacterium SM23_39]|nr:MAG: hypothetical protein AMS24_02140 [Chlamydiae bacterium SM23_39]